MDLGFGEHETCWPKPPTLSKASTVDIRVASAPSPRALLGLGKARNRYF